MRRREFIAGVAALGTLPRGAAAVPSAPGFEVPAGTCDTHVHVLDPARFPYSPRRRYTPGAATVAELVALHDALGITRVVVVQNSVYGSDHRCLLDALRQLGPDRARGVGAVGDGTTAEEIATLDGAGVRGTRLNLQVGRDRDASAAAAAVRSASARIPSGWHIHINAALPVIAAMADTLNALPQPVVLDHFAHADADGGADQPGMAEVIGLLRTGRAYVKLSGPYQISTRPDYTDVAPIARALVIAAPDRIIWGSDWPHTAGTGRPTDQPMEFVEAFRTEDDGLNLGLLAGWVPDPALRRRILVEMPGVLYGFPAAGG